MRVTVKALGRGKFFIQIRGKLPDGTKIRERLTQDHPTRRYAEDWANERLSKLVRGEAETEEPDADTLKVFFKAFIRDHCKARNYKHSGIRSKEKIFEKYYAHLHDRPINRITRRDLAEIASRCSGAGLSAKTTNNVLSDINSMLKVAEEWELIRDAPRAKLLRTNKKRMPFLSMDHYDRLVEGARKAGQRELAVILLGGDAGLRASEILALTWADVDIDRRVIIVRRAEVIGVLDDTKGLEERGVPMTDELAAALTPMRRASGRVIRGRGKGGRIDRKTLNELVRNAEAKAGLPITGKLHILRHSFASHLVSVGESIYQVQAAMGHQQVSTTQGYAKLSPTALQALATALNARRKTGSMRALENTTSASG